MTESQQFTCLIHRPRCRDLRIDLKLGSNGGPQQASAFDLGCRANQLHNIGVWRAWKPKLFEVLPSHAEGGYWRSSRLLRPFNSKADTTAAGGKGFDDLWQSTSRVELRGRTPGKRVDLQCTRGVRRICAYASGHPTTNNLTKPS